MPRIPILAVPDGAGKSTFAKSRFDALVSDDRFLKFDDIAAGLPGVSARRHAVAAARIGIKRRREPILNGRSFGVETTLAGRTILGLMAEAHRLEYTADFVFLYIAAAILCRRRAEQRVSLGGNDIPPDTIARRYIGGLANVSAA